MALHAALLLSALVLAGSDVAEASATSESDVADALSGLGPRHPRRFLLGAPGNKGEAQGDEPGDEDLRALFNMVHVSSHSQMQLPVEVARSALETKDASLAGAQGQAGTQRQLVQEAQEGKTKSRRSIVLRGGAAREEAPGAQGNTAGRRVLAWQLGSKDQGKRFRDSVRALFHVLEEAQAAKEHRLDGFFDLVQQALKLQDSSIALDRDTW